MISTYTQGKLTWVDVLTPSSDEARELLETYELPPELVNDIAAPVPRSGALCTNGILRATMSFPIVRRTDINHPHEIKFLVTKDALITVRYEDMEAIHKFQKEFEVLATLKKPGRGANGAHLFFALLSTLYEALGTKLDYLETRMQDVEQAIFDGQEKQTVVAISEVSRRLITFRHTIKEHDEVLKVLHDQFEVCFSKAVAANMRAIDEQYAFLTRRTNILFEALEELRNMNFALLTTKQNEVMKILTIMAFITFPLSLFTSMFGMNTQHTPILGLPGDFWIIVAMMSFITLGFFMFFKYKRWI